MNKLIGSVVEIPVAKGFAYAICTHKHPSYQYLLRVFSSTYSSRPDDLSELVSGDVQFSAFFSLNAAVRRKIFDIVGKVEVPEVLREFPIFRTGMPDRDTKKVKCWFLWDGESFTKVGAISEEIRKYPIRGVYDQAILVSRIESGYRPENDPAN
ncbi:hypothetical protein MWU49_06560 [Alcanivorax sp. S6407]|uniref:Imm26 family immunity protein n=1 Tax=Alcanivorax sp. S6407 TaxID=2926424 RepID=UPI001FF18335|nr:Imm26 family immunity protein [Alcanivorax sp. S6407]MCK0153355.1 hypothetical protein [Alcanivorax sp. S6407]